MEPSITKKKSRHQKPKLGKLFYNPCTFSKHRYVAAEQYQRREMSEFIYKGCTKQR